MATAKTKPAEKVAPGKKAVPQPAKGRRVDWDAIQRDYRTDKYTLRQLEAKHGVSYAQICRKASGHKWTKDLREVIKQATDDALLREAVTAAQQDATKAVLVAAEVNKQIILGHRGRLADLAHAVDKAKAKLLTLGDAVADIREAATFVQAVGNLATATKTLLEQQRKAYQIDDEQPDSGDKPTRIELVAL